MFLIVKYLCMVAQMGPRTRGVKSLEEETEKELEDDVRHGNRNDTLVLQFFVPVGEPVVGIPVVLQPRCNM